MDFIERERERERDEKKYNFRWIALKKFNAIVSFCGHKIVARSRFKFFSFSCFCNSFRNWIYDGQCSNIVKIVLKIQLQQKK